MAKEFALIGCGNMGGAIARGIVGAGLIAPEDIVVSDVSQAAQERLAGELGCAGTCDNVEAVRGAKMVLIAVKPQYLDGVVSAFADAVDDEAIVVSIAAGVSIERLEGLLGSSRKIVRVMPNLAATVRAAMSSLSPNANVSEDEVAQVKSIFDALGRAEVVPEHLIDAVIAVSGSSPAYVCVFIEALADAAVAEGMPRAQAYTFAEQAVMGTAKYLLETGTHPAVLKDMVSSPAGTTIEAVAALEAGGLRATVIDAARAAAARNRAM
ncbi:pyrroline-5-carboxylate reductase [Collinsella sp. An2]|uniref:pyrroline-5-carboxylate reductase n=1 Tax=Collinsella sp. An2 TaxID=1965585 RepID=UPI000B39EC37|nr:pyrroline-5-carboxylate reductase [Collinsella sp. An2]OUP08434.1 pyrroline-5-carboxylate reductase [Collinsella sp. An2]